MVSDRGFLATRLAGAFVIIVGCLFGLIAHARAAQDNDEPGRAPFERVCSNCHGKDAKGATGPSLLPFTRSVDELLAIVREGGAQMMAFSAKDVSDEQVRVIAAYLRSLKGTDGPE